MGAMATTWRRWTGWWVSGRGLRWWEGSLGRGRVTGTGHWVEVILVVGGAKAAVGGISEVMGGVSGVGGAGAMCPSMKPHPLQTLTPPPLTCPAPGRIVHTLDSLGLSDRTLVHFTSDNGGWAEAVVGGERLGGWNGIFRGE